MMVRPRVVPNVAKAAVLVAMAQARGRWVRTAELPAPSAAAITSSGIAASVKPVAKWTAEASAKAAASAAIAVPALLLAVRRRLGSASCGVEITTAPQRRSVLSVTVRPGPPLYLGRQRFRGVDGRAGDGRAAVALPSPGRVGAGFRARAWSPVRGSW